MFGVVWVLLRISLSVCYPRPTLIGVSPSGGTSAVVGAAFSVVFADHDVNVTVGVTFLADHVDVVADGMTYQENIDLRRDSVYDYEYYCDNCLGLF